jgi:hypothetical protein
MENMRNGYKIFVEKPEGERPLRRPTRRWEGNIEMNLEETGCELGSSSTGYAPVNTTMDLRVT